MRRIDHGSRRAPEKLREWNRDPHPQNSFGCRGAEFCADTAHYLAIKTKHFSEVFREAGNGNADIADIALQQLMDAEV